MTMWNILHKEKKVVDEDKVLDQSSVKSKNSNCESRIKDNDHLDDDIPIIDENIHDCQRLSEVTSPIPISKAQFRLNSSSTSSQKHSNYSITTSSSPISKSSSNIFERSVQDQATISSISRRNSINQLALKRTQSFSTPISPTQTISHDSNGCCCNKNIPNHLNSELFIPTCLDATTEVLIKTNQLNDLNDIDIIQSSNLNINNYLDSVFKLPSRQLKKTDDTQYQSGSKSIPLSRRQSGVSNLLPLSPIQHHQQHNHNSPHQFLRRTKTLDSTNNNETIPSNSYSYTNVIEDEEDEEAEEEDNFVDYSKHEKTLNFCSFADLLSNELESYQSSENWKNDFINMNQKSITTSTTTSPISTRKNSSIFIAPAISSLNLEKFNTRESGK